MAADYSTFHMLLTKTLHLTFTDHSYTHGNSKLVRLGTSSRDATVNKKHFLFSIIEEYVSLPLQVVLSICIETSYFVYRIVHHDWLCSVTFIDVSLLLN